MKKSKLVLLATLLALAAFPALAQVNDTYVIPAVANSQGGFGTRWMTRLSIFNPQLEYPLVVSVSYVPSGGLQGSEVLITIPENSLYYSDNALDDLFDRSGGGSFLVATFPEDNPGVPDDVIARAFLVTSDTYNNDPDGTYGQTIAGIWTGLYDYEYDDYGISAVAHGIRNIASEGWRTNVGAVNLGRCNANLLVSVYDADGRTLANQIPLTLPPLGHIQQTLPVQVDNGSVEFIVDDPCATTNDYAIVFPYTSTIDQFSGDPAYQSPTLLAGAGGLYAKKLAINLQSPGRKVDLSKARDVRNSAQRLGQAALVHTTKGWKSAK